MWRVSPLRGFSASTRTPTSIEVRQAALTQAWQLSRSPTWIGSTKAIRSTPAVTIRVPQWRSAAIPAASSHIFITTPPCTNPARLASWTPIHLTSVECVAEAGRGSTR